MSRLLGLVGITVSFEESQRYTEELLQVQVSANTIRSKTQRLGAQQQQREAKLIAQSQDLEALQARERLPERPRRLYGSIDGAFTPLKGAWKEAKVVTWYQACPRYSDKSQHAEDIAYYASLEPAETFGELVWATGVHNKKRMRYREFREAGYLIGSGTVESACKQVVTQRLKRAGAR